MAEISQFQDSQPILQTTRIASGASGKESLAEAFSMTGKVALQQAEQMHKDHSSAMMMNSTAQINSIMTDAKIAMMNNPGKADEISNNAAKNLSQIGSQQVSSGDKSKLDFLVNESQNKLRLQSAEHSIRQGKLQAVGDFWQAYNESMPQLSEAFNSLDEKKANIISNEIINNAKNAVMQGVITPKAFENLNKSIIGMHSRAEEIHGLLSKNDATAKDLHAANLEPLSNNNVDVSELPANSVTTSVANHHSTLMTHQDLDNDIYNFNLNANSINTLMSQSNEQFRSSVEKLRGSRDAHATINSNSSYTDITSRIKELENKPNTSAKESSELKVYQDMIKGLESGGFWEMQAYTSLGAQAINEWNNEKAAIQNNISYGLTPEAQAEHKEKLMAEADNNFIDKGVANAEAMHMDPRFINPVPGEIVSKVQTAFDPNGDSSDAIAQISRIKPRNIGYLAKQMKKGPQKEVITSVGFGYNNNMSPDFANDYISANRDGNSFPDLNVEDKISDATIRSQIASNIPGIIQLFSSQGGDRNNDLIKSAVNYVKYRASTSGDFAMDNLDEYVNDFSREMQNAYNLNIRSNSIFNNSQIQLSNADQDTLQRYALTKAQENFLGDDANSLSARGALSKTDFTMYIDSTNHIVVKDHGHTSFFYEPYSDHLLAAAREHSGPIQLTEQQKFETNEKMKQYAPWYVGGF